MGIDSRDPTRGRATMHLIRLFEPVWGRQFVRGRDLRTKEKYSTLEVIHASLE